MRPSSTAPNIDPCSVRASLDPDSETLLRAYRKYRESSGASLQSARRECSQLRVIVRAISRTRTQRSILNILSDPQAVANALMIPLVPVSESTVRSRLIAVQRLLTFVCPLVGRNAETEIMKLDALLPARTSQNWREAGTVVGGIRARRRARGPALSVDDLLTIVASASDGGGSFCNLRDQALIALQCFSGVRIEEAIGLCWEDIVADLDDERYFGHVVRVKRRGTTVFLPLHNIAANALFEFRAYIDSRGTAPVGSLFRTRYGSVSPVNYRTARRIVAHACERAKVPPVTSSDLRSAYAWVLKTQGSSDHQIMLALGLSRVKSVDLLLRNHNALAAQRQVQTFRRKQLDQLSNGSSTQSS